MVILDWRVMFKFMVVILIVGMWMVMVLNLFVNLGRMCFIFVVRCVLIGIIDWLVVWVLCKFLW